MNFIHTRGYSEDHSIRDWYVKIKKAILDRIENYNEIRNYFFKEKNLLRENL